MNKIEYKMGDVIKAAKDAAKTGSIVVIPHICNDKSAWGAGFVLALSRSWPEPESRYRIDSSSLILGSVQLINVEKNIFVLNMIAQTLGWTNNKPPIKYDYLLDCLIQAGNLCVYLNAEVFAPRFGAGLAGGDWSLIESLVQENLVDNGTPVTIFDLP